MKAPTNRVIRTIHTRTRPCQVHIFLAFYVFASSLNNKDLYASFGFSSRPTLMGLFLFFQAIWGPIDKVP